MDPDEHCASAEVIGAECNVVERDGAVVVHEAEEAVAEPGDAEASRH
jgi:hypothetical protein